MRSRSSDGGGVDDFPKEALLAIVRTDPVVVEAGAHRGGDTRDLAALWPKGHIYALEPVPGPFSELKEATARLENVTARQVALGTEVGRATMWVSSGASDASSSLREPKEHLTEHPDVAFEEQVEVDVVTLDSLAASEGLDRVDLLWLDLQGSELDVLRASPEVVASARAIVTEVLFKELYAGAPLWEEARPWFEAQGFRVQLEQRPSADWGNVLLVRDAREAGGPRGG